MMQHLNRLLVALTVALFLPAAVIMADSGEKSFQATLKHEDINLKMGIVRPQCLKGTDPPPCDTDMKWHHTAAKGYPTASKARWGKRDFSLKELHAALKKAGGPQAVTVYYTLKDKHYHVTKIVVKTKK
jgi:hypothetical protein